MEERGTTLVYTQDEKIYHFNVPVRVKITDYERKVVTILAAENKILAVRFLRDRFQIGLRNALDIVNDLTR